MITIFPNPASTKINIDIPDHVPTVLTVYDILGKQLIQKSNVKTIDLNELNDGIYLLKVTIDNKILTKRFIVKKS
jgi:spore coat protein CotH